MSAPHQVDDAKLRQGLERLAASGTRLFVENGHLVADGNALSDEQLEFLRTHRGALTRVLSARRLWKVTGPDGLAASHAFTPPATLEQARNWYPTARAIEPEEEVYGKPDAKHLTLLDTKRRAWWGRVLGNAPRSIATLEHEDRAEAVRLGLLPQDLAHPGPCHYPYLCGPSPAGCRGGRTRRA